MQYKIKEAEDTGLQLAAQITDSQNWRHQGMIDAAFELADTNESSKPLLRVRTDLSL